MSRKLKWLLLRYFTLGVVEGEDGGAGDAEDAGADGGAADAGAQGGDEGGLDDLGGGDLESLIEAGEATLPDDKAAKKREADELAREREARIRAEVERDTERRLRAESGHRAQPNAEQAIFEEEQRRLADPATTEIEKWQIQSNRTLRANTQASNRAMTEAADMRDQAQFDRLAITHPKVHKAYAERVESELQKMRAQGQNAPRAALLRFILGNDMIEGKLKGKTARKPAAAAADAGARPSGVSRGKPPGARSDVSAKQRQTEREKREARLANVQI